MEKRNLELEDARVDHEIHNERIKLLSTSIADLTDDIDSVLKAMQMDKTIATIYLNDIRTYADIILELSISEIKKSQSN